MGCEGCDPDPGNLARPPVVLQVAAKNGMEPVTSLRKTQMEAALAASDKSLGLTPQTAPGVHPLILDALNQLRSLHLELVSVVTLLLRRGLITETELTQARMEVTQSAQQAFQEAKQQLGRELAQKPTHLPSQPTSNPRRGPS